MLRTLLNRTIFIAAMILSAQTLYAQTNTDKLKALLESVDAALASKQSINHQEVRESILTLVTNGEDPANPNIQTSHGSSAMHLAAIFGHTDLLVFLSDLGANVNAQNNVRHTALHLAAQFGQVAAIQTLVQLGANNRQAALLTAARHGQVAAIQTLVQLGAGNLQSALYIAAQYGQVAAIQTLVQLGANVNAQVPNGVNAPFPIGTTALHVAAQYGPVATIQALIQLCANVDLPNNQGYTALHVAAQFGQVAALQTLGPLSANVNATDHQGNTAMHVAAQFGQVAVIHTLQQLGADINLKNYKSYLSETPLHLAAYHGHIPAAIQLLLHGADSHLAKYRAKAATIARQQGHNDLAKLLTIAQNADGRDKLFNALLDYAASTLKDMALVRLILESRSVAGESLIHTAVRLRNHAALEFLLAHDLSTGALGTSINALNASGVTPLYLALVNRDEGAVNLLLEAGADPTFGAHSSLALASHVPAFKETHSEEPTRKKQKLDSRVTRNIMPPSLLTTIYTQSINMIRERIHAFFEQLQQSSGLTVPEDVVNTILTIVLLQNGPLNLNFGGGAPK